MLTITIPATEQWDEANECFITSKSYTLALEHSLVSLSKWESVWNKPFLSRTDGERTIEQTIDYIRCMTLTQNVPPEAYSFLTEDNIREVNAYIDAPMTATWFSGTEKGKIGSEQITAELIYYWMIQLGIPFECQKWHLNRLMTLIRVCSEKNKKPKKMSAQESLQQRRALNAARRKKYHTRG